jgi:4-amino-4-deoxy-L-arabinose transferase-like glycosyltransferase
MDSRPLKRWTVRTRAGQVCAFVAVLLVAALLRLWRLDRNGFGNGYYAAAVRSMLVSPTNFFFGAFDPAGFITVDKPPGAIWVQAISARIFGYRGLSLLVPQAIFGIATAAVTFGQIRRLFGTASGLLAAAVVALTPIAVAVDRDNLPDSLLTLLLVLAAGALIRSLSTNSWPFLSIVMVLVGAAFNVKMLAAFVVLPTFFLVYLLFAQAGWKVKITRLAIASVLLAAVSLSWSLVVYFTPASRRPYIGGSQTNSALELALGYNGLGRIFGGLGNLGPPGQRGDFRPRPSGPGPDTSKKSETDRKDPITRGKSTDLKDATLVAARPDPDNSLGPPDPDDAPPDRGARRAMGGSRPPFPGRFPRFGGPPGGFGGTPGFLRFTRPQLAEQITWLFPLAFFGAWAGFLQYGLRISGGPQQAALVTWVGWLATHVVVFSFARGIFHEYYSIIMGPAVAAIVGIGVPALWQQFQTHTWRRSLLPTALIATGAWQAYLIGQHAALRYKLLPISLGAICLATTVLLVSQLGIGGGWRRLLQPSGILLGVVAALIAPATWCVATTMSPGFSLIPTANISILAGDDPGRPPTPGPGPGPGAELPTERLNSLVDFLRTHRDGEKYCVAAMSAMQVQSIIIHTGEPAIALGGFMGADPVLTKDKFIELVDQGQLRYVLAGGPGPGGGFPFGPRRGGRFPLPAGGGGNGGPPLPDPNDPDPFPPDPGGPGPFPSGPGGPGPFPRGPGGPFPPGGPMGGRNAEIMEWVRDHGKLVDAKLWRTNADEEPDDPAPPGRPPRGLGELYDLKAASKSPAAVEQQGLASPRSSLE